MSAKRKGRFKKSHLFSILITLGFVLLGGLIGVIFGAFLYTYFIPVWRHNEIDTGDHNFVDIVFVDYYYLNNADLSQDNVILKTDEGDYYSFYQNNWRLTEEPVVEQTRFPNNIPSCTEWLSPPPAVYLSRPLDTEGVEFAHALAITSRCYVLLKDGSFHSWTRDYGVFEMIFLGKATLIMGMVIGGVLGVRVARSKYRRQTSI